MKKKRTKKPRPQRGVLENLHTFVIENHLGHALSAEDEDRITPSIEQAPFQDIRNAAAYRADFGSHFSLSGAEPAGDHHD